MIQIAISRKRDSLAIILYTKSVAFQKLDYTHHNPTTESGNPASDPCQYYYSSAKFYKTGENKFGFLKDLRQKF
ncbi:MAG: hypothetical protein ABIP79_05480 [Chitinophagaceae bacterium]